MLAIGLASCAVMPIVPDAINHTNQTLGNVSDEPGAIDTYPIYYLLGVPAPVYDKYLELEAEYNSSLGAGINRCVSPPYTSLGEDNHTLAHFGPQIIYSVWGSGGYTGVEFYYFENGEEFGGKYEWSDAISGNESPSPLNTSIFNCTNIISSKNN